MQGQTLWKMAYLKNSSKKNWLLDLMPWKKKLQEVGRSTELNRQSKEPA